MAPSALDIPFLLGSKQPKPDELDFVPTHIVSWSTPSEAGPSRRIALAAPDNTIWVYPDPRTASASQPLDLPPAPSAPLPTIRATSPTPSGTPRMSRPANPRVDSFSNRSRAPSNASSTRTASSRRRVTPFSSPTSAQPVIASISPATATVAASDGHGRVNSLSEKAELMEHLREQQARNSEEGRSSVGLGISLGRKLDVHGQADHDKVSGSTSPKSVRSVDSQRTSIGGRLMGWAKGADNEEQKIREELDEQVAEIAVEREMELETEKDARQEDEMKTVEEAIARTSPSSTPTEASRHSSCTSIIHRIVLRQPGHGRIVAMKVYKELGLLCILRDVGFFDTFRLSDLEQTAAVDMEAPREGVASSSKRTLRLTPFWRWTGMHLASHETTPLLAVEGLPWSCGLPSHNGDVTRVVLLSMSPEGSSKVETGLDLPGQGCICLCVLQGGTYLLHSTQTSLTSYIIERPTKRNVAGPNRPSSALGMKQHRATSSAQPSPRTHLDKSSNEAEQPLLRKNRSVASLRESQPSPASDHNSFAKFLAAKKADWRGDRTQAQETEPADSIRLDEGREVERDGGGSWHRIMLSVDGRGVGIVDDAVDAFEYNGSRLAIQKTITLEPGDMVRDVVFTSNMEAMIVLANNKVISYVSRPGSSGSNDLTRHEALVEDAHGIAVDEQGGIWILQSEGVSTLDSRDPTRTRMVMRASRDGGRAEAAGYTVPSLGGQIWASDYDGNVNRQTLSGLLSDKVTGSIDAPDVDRLGSPVTCMRLVQAQKRYLVAGDEDGGVRMWDDRDRVLLASWTLFADAVESIAYIDADHAGILRHHVLCTSRDGTVGVISLTDMEHLFLIPASRGPLRRIFHSGKDILLAYVTGKARLWNVETMEFRRSTGLDAADDMLASGKWHEVDLDGSTKQTNCALGPLAARIRPPSDIGAALMCDLRKLSAELKQLPTPHGLAMLSGLLSAFLTFGIEPSIDQVSFTHLGILEPKQGALLGDARFSSGIGIDAWHRSSRETGLRQLIILTLLRPFLDSNEHEQYAVQAIAFYATGLPDSTISADLSFFAQYYLDPSSDVEQAARMLFNSTLDRLSESELEALVTGHQSKLPYIQTKGETSIKDQSAQSLLMIGAIALHKYQSVNPTALKAVAETILAILKDPSSAHLDLAIELCSKGYTIWQTFADPMDLLRRLFHLSTRKDASSINAQARLAVLHVASSNPALFMSTLSMDILDAQSAEGRTSIMKLCVFMARKKPEVLENGLPRIAEAVVKSLDPNIGKMRDDVWQAATVILNELVLAFSTIDFHSGTQKLAVGTHEGAVIMYELKTASRLYVLEPHRGPVSSVTFSPDGRRLLTVSLEEGVVTVWKVGSSLSGFFNVGGPPRQGALGGSGPFKRIEFARVDDGPLKSTSALSNVHVSWPGPRQAKVSIGETAMSFET